MRAPNPNGPVIRVMVAEDDPLAQQAIETYLSHANDMELIGIASDGQSALELAATTDPDVAIIDIHMPKVDGIEVTRRLTQPPSRIKVVCFTALGDDNVMLDAIHAGASGFLLKTDSPGLVLHGVRTAFSGEALVSPKLIATVLANSVRRIEPPRHLSETERELLVLIGRGFNNAEIAEKLILAPSTVKTYVSRLLARLDRPNRAALATLAYEWGLMDPSKKPKGN